MPYVSGLKLVKTGSKNSDIILTIKIPLPDFRREPQLCD